MTITPTAPTTTATAAGTNAPPPCDPASAADFLVAIVQALAPTAAPATAADPEDQDTAQGEDPGISLATPGLTAPPDVAVQLAAAVAIMPAAAPGRANVAGGADASITTPISDICPSGDAAVAARATGVAADAEAATAGGPLGVQQSAARGGVARIDAPSTPIAYEPSDSGAAPSSPSAPSAPVVPTAAGSTRSESVDQPTPVITTPAGSPVIAPGTAVVTSTAPEVTGTEQVTRQVFPEVTGLVSRGNGTHRITLTLNPEALGEVRVVMTVRDGAVVVRLAAGQDAQQALADGSPELTRLLELAGASETRIVVRDLGAGSSTGSGTGAGSSPETGPDTGRPHDQHAGTRAHHPATDGTNDGTTRTFRSTTGAHPSQSIEPVTDARTAGVDVTM